MGALWLADLIFVVFAVGYMVRALWRNYVNECRYIDPPGWDRAAGRAHDCTPTPGGLLHHSTCWCRER